MAKLTPRLAGGKLKVMMLFFVLAVGAFSGSLMAEEKQGATVLVRKMDGQTLKGELLDVEQSRLLVMASGTDVGQYVDIGNIRTVEVDKTKSTMQWVMPLIGFIAGCAIGATTHGPVHNNGPFPGMEETNNGLVTGGLIGGLVGLGAGIALGKHDIERTVIAFEGKSPEELRLALDELRPKARFSKAK